MSKKVVNFGIRKWLVATAGALAVVSTVALANHGVARPGHSDAVACTTTKYEVGQPIVVVSLDGTASTDTDALRTEYARALSGIAAAASSHGAYLIVNVFGSTVGNIRTVCSTSTRVAGAAPLFVTAQQTALLQLLEKVTRRASRVSMGAAGSSIYGALADGIQRAQLLRAGQPVAASVVVITDGDEAADGVHLRRLLASGAPNPTIVARIIGKLAPPDARGLSIQIEGVGRLGNGRPVSSQSVRRMQDIWTRICAAAHASRCLVTTDTLGNLH